MPTPPEEREGSAEDALRRLERRLDRASEAAGRLMAEAAAHAAGAGNPANPGNPSDPGDPGNPGNPGNPGDPPKPPPAGWQIPEASTPGTHPELDPLVSLVQAMRELIPPELQRRLIAALRELLLALRAVIDWYLERLERRREQGVEVQDIPIL
jgi:hypothetical protein